VVENPQNPNLNQIEGPKNLAPKSQGVPLRLNFTKIFRSFDRFQIWVLGVFGDADSKSAFGFALSGLEVGLMIDHILGTYLWPPKIWAKSEDFGPKFSGTVE
jgi:hypothetical protein